MTAYPSVPLGEICIARTGTRDPRKAPEDAFRYVDIASVDNQSKRITEAKTLPGRDAPSRARRVIQTDDVLVSMTRPNLNAVAMVPPYLDGEICSTGFGVLRAGEYVLPAYLFHFVTSQPFIRTACGAVSGALYPAITEKFLRSVEIPLPPLDEQRRIVDILNRAASLHRLRDQARAKLRALIPALFIRMFGDDAPQSTERPTATIEELLATKRGSIRTGPFGSQLKHSEFTDQGIPVLGIDNAVTNRFRWAKPRHLPPEKYARFIRYRVFPGDVIVTIMGTTGRVCVAPDDLPECMSTKHLCVLTLDQSKVDPVYVWGALLYDEEVRAQTRVHGQGQIMEGWNLTIVKGLRMRVPSLVLQEKFAQAVAHLYAMETIAETAAETASAVSASLMARLFGDAA